MKYHLPFFSVSCRLAARGAAKLAAVLFLALAAGLPAVQAQPVVTATLPALGGMAQPMAVAINPANNKIYVAGGLGGNDIVTVIDGATNTTTPINLLAGSLPVAVAVNPVTNKVYIVN